MRIGRVAFLILSTALFAPLTASADLFQFSFQTYQYDSNVPDPDISGLGTFDASPQCGIPIIGTRNFTVTSLFGSLTIGNSPNAQHYDMGFTFDPCQNLVTSGGTINGGDPPRTISFTADGDQWELEQITLPNPFQYELINRTNPSLDGAIKLNISPVPEASALSFLGIGIFVLSFAVLKRQIPIQSNSD